MSLTKIVTPPDTARMRETANPQSGSILFGGLPLEIRDMIYVECWKVSGLNQHIFIRAGRLTHWPCALSSDEVDERPDELQRMLEAQETQRRSRTRSLKLDDKWTRRFSSPWHNHWRCEEEMEMMTNERTGLDHLPRPNRTLFLPILLACKRTYLESRPSLYAMITPIFTSLPAAHAFSTLSPKTVSSQLHSLSFSLALPIETLHQHHQQTHPTDPPGPWADLCTHLSNLVRFAALRDVTLRLAVSATDTTTDYINRRNDDTDSIIKVAIGPTWRDLPSWPSVRERWALSAVRGLLARRLVVQLPLVTPTYRYPEWVRQFQYLEDDARGVPFRRLERYTALPAMRLRKDVGIGSRGDGSEFMGGGEKGRGETRLQRTRRSVRRLVGGLKSG
ncbi:uncharacterized protein GGS22DRAFT_83092 [Annulohypoxylon maeteangense]|uniref:uncharacterized protein n=1 Tax=Annulohypoxylon maeteangense TaxID=1927788 RepID=UPI002007CF95|nr:uncharacterized protein GGS22DRAFT_83092 [Annulohypoxylon maeteangense]KAI0880567.1 hypothetical protein GGS22DRAFT_83092 [Annulohypoxylon maeteangense]